MADPISVVVTRGDVVESRHRAHAVAVRDGRVVESAGDPELVTFLRSSAKPFQALPLAREHPDLPATELAIACASHEALPEQLAAVQALLERAEATEDDLECGPAEGSRLRNNCSGKHAGMLLRSRARGWPTVGYRLPDHPLQRDVLELVADAAGVPPDDVSTGNDGCGVVAFAMPLWRMAAMFARLVRGDFAAADRVVGAMRTNPQLIGGPDAVDTALMLELPGAIAKRGAEGLICGATEDGTGFAVKVEDGANRAAGPAAAAFLGVTHLRESAVFNSRAEEVGRIFALS